MKVFLAEFITKQAQQTGHLTVLNHHNSMLVAIELKGVTQTYWVSYTYKNVTLNSNSFIHIRRLFLEKKRVG